MSLSKIDFSRLSPAPYEDGPTKGTSPGRLFKFDEQFTNAQIDFQTNISDLSQALAILTSTKVDDDGFHHVCSCNGPHHALIVAKFSSMVAAEMLDHPSMKEKIDGIIDELSPETQEFLRANDYQNYKKIIELMALFHDTGRPNDGIDQWDDSNEINVEHNVGYLLRTVGLSEKAVAEILQEIKSGIENKDNTKLKNDNGFLFGVALGAGDSLHSGHAFHGELWDGTKARYNPDYSRLYKQYPDFRDNFNQISAEVGKFVPYPTREESIYLVAVNNYLQRSERDHNGWSVIKPDFTTIISNEFSALDAANYPIMAKHFGANYSLQIENRLDLPLEENNQQVIVNNESVLDKVVSFFKTPSLARNLLIGAMVGFGLLAVGALVFATPAGPIIFSLLVTAAGSTLLAGVTLGLIAVLVIGIATLTSALIGMLVEHKSKNNIESVLPNEPSQTNESSTVTMFKGPLEPAPKDPSVSEASEVPHIVRKTPQTRVDEQPNDSPAPK